MPATTTTSPSVPVRLAAFAVAVLVAGLLGAGLGAIVGPVDVGGGHGEGPAPVTHDEPGGTHG